MTKQVKILFFGSTTDSVIVLKRIFNESTVNSKLSIVAVVTQPPRPVGRDKVVTSTPVELWGKAHNITTLSFESNKEKPWLYENEQQVIDTLLSVNAEIIISASYGQKIPTETLQSAKYGGLNVHPSILPRWRGGDPVPWAILSGDHQIGVTVVTLSDKFDEGLIVAQKKIPITNEDTSTPLRTKLFDIGATLLVDILPDYINGKIKGVSQKNNDEPQAKRLTREMGFEPWDAIKRAIDEGIDAERIERKFRAFSPWPGVWTKLNLQISKSTNGKFEEKRLKIVSLRRKHEKLVIDSVQLEGKNPVSWEQFREGHSL